MENFSGKMYSIHSGNLQQVGWEFDQTLKVGVLRAVFNNQKVYDYWPVPKELFSELFKAESRGKWFHQNIVSAKSISYEEVTE